MAALDTTKVKDGVDQETVDAVREVTELIEAKNRAKLSTTCTIQDGTLVLEGEALVMLPKA